MSNKKENIFIIGPPGIGKSTTIKAIKRLKPFPSYKFHFEDINFKILEAYYAEEKKSKWALILQSDFLNIRFTQLLNFGNKVKYNIFDRSITDDLLYIQLNYDNGFITKEERDVLFKTHDMYLDFLTKEKKLTVDKVIVLKSSAESLKERLEARDRFNEADVEYLKVEMPKIYFGDIKKTTKHFKDGKAKSVSYVETDGKKPKQIAKEVIKLIKN